MFTRSKKWLWIKNDEFVYSIFKENVALNQLSEMRKHLDEKTKDLGLSDDDHDHDDMNDGGGNGRRRSSIWEGLAEVWMARKFEWLLNSWWWTHYFWYNKESSLFCMCKSFWQLVLFLKHACILVRPFLSMVILFTK